MNSSLRSPAKIFLADDRGFIENKIHRRYSTFNFGEFCHEHKQPFGDLYMLNDEILPAGGELSQQTSNSGIMLLVPVVGAIILEINEQVYQAEAGDVLSVPVSINMHYTIRNPIQSTWINFLHLELKGRSVTTKVSKHNFDIDNNANELITVISDISVSYKLSIGRFAGREDFIYGVAPNSNVFAFIIAGAWELQNRLMHERDGLALWNTTKIEAEALSNGAVILILELKYI